MDSDIRRRVLWVQLYQRIGNAGLVCRRREPSRPTLRKWVRLFHEGDRRVSSVTVAAPCGHPINVCSRKKRRLVLILRVERKLGARPIQSELRCHHDLKLSSDSIHEALAINQVSQLVPTTRPKMQHQHVGSLPWTACSSTLARLLRNVISTRRLTIVRVIGCWQSFVEAQRQIRWHSWSASWRRCRSR